MTGKEIPEEKYFLRYEGAFEEKNLIKKRENSTFWVRYIFCKRG